MQAYSQNIGKIEKGEISLQRITIVKD